MSLEDSAKALADKLDVILNRPTMWTGQGYLHVLQEGEIDQELAALEEDLGRPPILGRPFRLRREAPPEGEAPSEPASEGEPSPEAQSEQPASF